LTESLTQALNLKANMRTQVNVSGSVAWKWEASVRKANRFLEFFSRWRWFPRIFPIGSTKIHLLHKPDIVNLKVLILLSPSQTYIIWQMWNILLELFIMDIINFKSFWPS
jgi:hypothetical protein